MTRTKRQRTAKKSAGKLSDVTATSATVNNKNGNNEVVGWVEDIDKIFQQRLRKLEVTLENVLQALTNSTQMLKMKIPPHILNKPLCQFQRGQDGRTQPSASKTVLNNTEIADINAVLKPQSAASHILSGGVTRTISRVLPSRFKTPASTCSRPLGPVTPKIGPNSALSVLRRPQQGELAISMSGSPLLVSGVTADCTANINVPLTDGRVITIMPEQNLSPSSVPPLDAITTSQLETLHDHLSCLLNR